MLGPILQLLVLSLRSKKMTLRLLMALGTFLFAHQ